MSHFSLFGGLGLPRNQSVQTFNQYRESEALNHLQTSVNHEGDLLDYETLELRVHPPNVHVLHGEGSNETVVTVDSANRPGTLVEVVQCMTELGLNISRARISSDGGWFVDEFHVKEPNDRPVTCCKKLSTLRKVLNVNFENDERGGAGDENNGPSTVLQLSGRDKTGLLADVTALLVGNGCVVISAAVWTYRNRVAFILSVTENGGPLQSQSKIMRLRQLLFEIMDAQGGATVEVVQVKKQHQVHHERRLHKLLLDEEVRMYEKAMAEQRELGMTASTPTYHVAPHVAVVDSPYVSTKYSEPQVSITYASHSKYWFITIRCVDRNKLLFDTVCTLSDMDFDIYHATIDCEPDKDYTGFNANQEFYVRPRLGIFEWDAEKAKRLKAMLTAAIMRRFPKGLKVHVQATQALDLANFTATLRNAKLSITRAKVKTTGNLKCAGHTFYVMSENGDPPDTKFVEETCRAVGGARVAAGEDGSFSAGPIPSGHKFSFSVLERSWRQEWGVGSVNSSGSSSS